MDTYLGDSDLFAVKKTSEVWGNPKPVIWCEYESKRVYSDEVADGKFDASTIDSSIQE